MTIERWLPDGDPEQHDFDVFRVRKYRSRSPRTGALRPFTVIDTGDWVNVVALTGDGQVVLVRQYRHGTDRVTLEVPGGAIDAGENPAGAAVRELLEETGYAGGAPEHLGTVDTNPAILSNRCHTYLIEGCARVADPDPDPGEDIEVVTMPAADVDAAVADGRITHSLVVCALSWWRAAR